MTQTTLPLQTSPADSAPAAGDSIQPISTSEEPVGKPAQPWPEMGQTWTYSDEPIFKLSVEAYHELARVGLLTSDDQVELIEGVLVHRMSKNPPHESAKRRLAVILNRLLPPGWILATEAPVTLPDSEPEPDVWVARGDIDTYDDRHPSPTEVGLVIEVANTTLRRDRGSKCRAYARGGVDVYWIVNLTARQIEVHTDPNPAAEPPAYPEPRVYHADEKIPVWLDGKMLGEVAVSDVLP